jgi:hypothetical protein
MPKANTRSNTRTPADTLERLELPTPVLRKPSAGLTIWATKPNRKGGDQATGLITKDLDEIKQCLEQIANTLGRAPKTTNTSAFTIEFGLGLKVTSGGLSEIFIGSGEAEASLKITMAWSQTTG